MRAVTLRGPYEREDTQHQPNRVTVSTSEERICVRAQRRVQ